MEWSRDSESLRERRFPNYGMIRERSPHRGSVSCPRIKSRNCFASDAEIVSLNQRHPNQGNGFSYLDKDMARLTVPDDHARMNIKELPLAVRKNCAAAHAPGKTQARDHCARKSQGAAAAGVHQA